MTHPKNQRTMRLTPRTLSNSVSNIQLYDDRKKPTSRYATSNTSALDDVSAHSVSTTTSLMLGDEYNTNGFHVFYTCDIPKTPPRSVSIR